MINYFEIIVQLVINYKSVLQEKTVLSEFMKAAVTPDVAAAHAFAMFGVAVATIERQSRIFFD